MNKGVKHSGDQMEGYPQPQVIVIYTYSKVSLILKSWMRDIYTKTYINSENEQGITLKCK